MTPPAPLASELPARGVHQWLIDRLERAYHRYRAASQQPAGRLRHSPATPYLATYLPRLCAPLFPDILWRISAPTTLGQYADQIQPRSQAATSHRTLYLTFDDGPSPEHTAAILNVLARYSVRATFFLVGEQAARFPGLVQEIAAAGHAVGNHTWSHRDAWMCLFPEVAEELRRTDELLCELTGQAISLVRPPHGHFTAKYRQYCQTRGQTLVMWDTLPGDFLANRSAEDLAQFTTLHARPGSIVVWHDSAAATQTVPVLEHLLPRLLTAGWSFDTLPHP